MFQLDFKSKLMKHLNVSCKSSIWKAALVLSHAQLKFQHWISRDFLALDTHQCDPKYNLFQCLYSQHLRVYKR